MSFEAYNAETLRQSRQMAVDEVERLETALRKIRALPTYSVSQGICIDASPDRLLKAAEVYRIIDNAIGSESDAQGKHD